MKATGTNHLTVITHSYPDKSSGKLEGYGSSGIRCCSDTASTCGACAMPSHSCWAPPAIDSPTEPPSPATGVHSSERRQDVSCHQDSELAIKSQVCFSSRSYFQWQSFFCQLLFSQWAQTCGT